MCLTCERSSAMFEFELPIRVNATRDRGQISPKSEKLHFQGHKQKRKRKWILRGNINLAHDDGGLGLGRRERVDVTLPIRRPSSSSSSPNKKNLGLGARGGAGVSLRLPSSLNLKFLSPPPPPDLTSPKCHTNGDDDDDDDDIGYQTPRNQYLVEKSQIIQTL